MPLACRRDSLQKFSSSKRSEEGKKARKKTSAVNRVLSPSSIECARLVPAGVTCSREESALIMPLSSTCSKLWRPSVALPVIVIFIIGIVFLAKSGPGELRQACKHVLHISHRFDSFPQPNFCQHRVPFAAYPRARVPGFFHMYLRAIDSS